MRHEDAELLFTSRQERTKRMVVWLVVCGTGLFSLLHPHTPESAGTALAELVEPELEAFNEEPPPAPVAYPQDARPAPEELPFAHGS